MWIPDAFFKQLNKWTLSQFTTLANKRFYLNNQAKYFPIVSAVCKRFKAMRENSWQYETKSRWIANAGIQHPVKLRCLWNWLQLSWAPLWLLLLWLFLTILGVIVASFQSPDLSWAPSLLLQTNIRRNDWHMAVLGLSQNYDWWIQKFHWWVLAKHFKQVDQRHSKVCGRESKSQVQIPYSRRKASLVIIRDSGLVLWKFETGTIYLLACIFLPFVCISSFLAPGLLLFIPSLFGNRIAVIFSTWSMAICSLKIHCKERSSSSLFGAISAKQPEKSDSLEFVSLTFFSFKAKILLADKKIFFAWKKDKDKDK